MSVTPREEEYSARNHATEVMDRKGNLFTVHVPQKGLRIEPKKERSG